MPFLQVIASLGKEPADDEKSQGDGDVENVKQHSNSKLAAGV
jgi:hypothetical protein